MLSVVNVGSARILLFWALFLSNGALSGREAEFIANVVHVGDGDSVTIMTGYHQKISIRLAYIDCPELHQAYGAKAKQYTSILALGRDVTVRPHGRDDRGRTLATLIFGDRNLNQELVEQGLAWAYLHYSAKYISQQKEAQAKRIGLWSEPNPVPPWDFRSSHKSVRSQSEKPLPETAIVYVTKSGKKYHRKGCSSLNADALPISIKDAQMRGYTPCKICNP